MYNIHRCYDNDVAKDEDRQDKAEYKEFLKLEAFYVKNAIARFGEYEQLIFENSTESTISGLMNIAKGGSDAQDINKDKIFAQSLLLALSLLLNPEVVAHPWKPDNDTK